MTHDEVLANIERYAQQYGLAVAEEMEMEDERALIKAEAISRLMQYGVASSVTAAEKVVEKDAEYAAHREKQIKHALHKYTVAGLYQSAIARARLAAGLAEALS